MKIPNTPINNGNGYFNNQETGVVQYLSDHSDSEDGDSPTQDGDFSEYLWMENEEEFDNQVLKQLEEEALMEQCIEAMLEDERDPESSSPSAPAAAWSNATSSPSASAAALVGAVESLHVSDDLAKGSTLNPNALEFVPREAPTSSSAPIESKA